MSGDADELFDKAFKRREGGGSYKFDLERVERFVEKAKEFYEENGYYACLPLSEVRDFLRDNTDKPSPYALSPGLYVQLTKRGVRVRKLRGQSFVEVVVEEKE